MGHNYVAHLCFPQNVLCVWPNLVEFEGNKIFPIGGKKYSTAKIMYISPGVYFCLSNVSIVSFVMYPSALSLTPPPKMPQGRWLTLPYNINHLDVTVVVNYINTIWTALN